MSVCTGPIKCFPLIRRMAFFWICPMRRLFLILVVVSIVYAALYIIYGPFTGAVMRKTSGMPNMPGDQVCVHPQLQLWSQEMTPFYKNASPIVCDPQTDWVEITGSIARISEQMQASGDVECAFSDIVRVTDDMNFLSMKTVTRTDYELVNSDFVDVKCQNGKSKSWKNIMAGIRNDPSAFQHAGWGKTPNDRLNLNVLIFGFDSMSRMHFLRKLPKTYAFIESAGGVVLHGYNIVGDGTPQALIPILTGKTELELPETRRRMGKKANHVDVYPFIWNDFHNNGYITGYMEDCSSFGTFTYRLKGFKDAPTDHYMRPFYVAATETFPQHKSFCLRSTPRHKLFMKYIKEFFHVHRHKPKFLFGFHGELSHDDINRIEVVDDDVVQMLRDLDNANHFNDTMVIIMSDHGNRFTSVRETMQGKQEERLPMFSFILPKWFRTKYAQAFENLKENAKRLTTPFDIHSTLMDVLHFNGSDKGNLYGRSISLFKEIPLERSCADADIEPHWCACLDWEEIQTNSPQATDAARVIVDAINNYTAGERDKCAFLNLEEIQWAGKLSPSKGLQKFKVSADHDGFVPNLSANTQVSQEVYQVHLRTVPGNGHYQASVSYSVSTKSFSMKIADVSRVNRYGDHVYCIQHNLDLRKFCHCV